MTALSHAISGVCLGVFFCTSASMAGTLKPQSIDHGSPVILRTDRCVIAVEFALQSHSEAFTSSNFPGGSYDLCKAVYRYKCYDYLNRTFDTGQGIVNENYKVRGGLVEDMGSKLELDVGGAQFTWSQGCAGSKSWLYFGRIPRILFIQQLKTENFDRINEDLLRKYQHASNINDAEGDGVSISVLGPSAADTSMSSDGLNTCPAVAGVSFADGVFKLSLTNMPVGSSCVIERSFTSDKEGWTEVHAFVTQGMSCEWTDRLDADVKKAFYRVKVR